MWVLLYNWLRYTRSCIWLLKHDLSLYKEILTAAEKQTVKDLLSMEAPDNNQPVQSRWVLIGWSTPLGSMSSLISSATLPKAWTFFHRQQNGKLQLSDGGMKNRLRADDKVHVDRIYQLMYPEKDNTTYRDDPNRVNRRQNVARSKYDVEIRINGPRHVQLMSEKRQKDE